MRAEPPFLNAACFPLHCARPRVQLSLMQLSSVINLDEISSICFIIGRISSISKTFPRKLSQLMGLGAVRVACGSYKISLRDSGIGLLSDSSPAPLFKVAFEASV